MLIVKTENPQLVARQLRFFERVGNPLKIVDVDKNGRGYQYNFEPGIQATYDQARYYLKNYIWTHGPLEGERLDIEDYVGYLQALEVSSLFDLDCVYETLAEAEQEPCLVHGDACLDNFLSTGDKTIPIDPGLPRSFSTQNNDIGKMLQEALTNWNHIKFLGPPQPFVPIFVDSVQIASLISHWLRILKNANRHPERVRRYGHEVVIPTLVKYLRDWEAHHASGLRWDLSILRKCHGDLLHGCSKCIRA